MRGKRINGKGMGLGGNGSGSRNNNNRYPVILWGLVALILIPYIIRLFTDQNFDKYVIPIILIVCIYYFFRSNKR